MVDFLRLCVCVSSVPNPSHDCFEFTSMCLKHGHGNSYLEPQNVCFAKHMDLPSIRNSGSVASELNLELSASQF